MKRTLFIVLALVALATASSAATLTVVSDKTTYGIGDTITLNVQGNGGSASAYGITGRFAYTGTGGVTFGTTTQKKANTGWTTATPVPGLDAFNQIGFLNGVGGQSQTNVASLPPNNLSTVTLIANAAGIVNVNWDTTTTGFTLDFFGLTNAAGTSFTITAVPEPTTAALLGLGLLGLVLGGGRRRSS
jgi:hypothetical protein